VVIAAAVVIADCCLGLPLSPLPPPTPLPLSLLPLQDIDKTLLGGIEMY
jgi:hypothetical protein